MEFMIANRRPCSLFDTSPCAFVTLEIFFRTIRVRQVADSHHGTGHLLEQFRRRFRACYVFAIGDIAGAYKDCSLLRLPVFCTARVSCNGR
jgi:hypothetical protein